MKIFHKIRKPILDQYKRVWLDKEAHLKLRILKKLKKRSMAQIVKDLILNEFRKYGRKK